jgi:SAM-dependent methyltransferase
MAPVDGYGPSSYGDGFADVYDDWYAEVSPAGDTASFVARRTRGPVVELGSGTGRLAAPMRAAGVAVVGIDASVAMLRRSVERDPRVPVAAADMADPPVRPGSAGAVLVAFNTLFNLPTGEAQERALRRACETVGHQGVVVVEAFVPVEHTGGGTDDRVDVARLAADVVVLRVSRTDHAARTVSGHHVELRDGAPVRLRPWHLHFTDPAGLDAMAARAGLELAERFADWSEAPFDAASPAHVSVYRPRQDRR